MENFETINKLGDGAYSVVYKVKRKQDNKLYALKIYMNLVKFQIILQKIK